MKTPLISAGTVLTLGVSLLCPTSGQCFQNPDKTNATKSITASANQASSAYEHLTFGEVLRATGPMAKAGPLRFSTKYQDDETDLLYYGYRYYNASIGRWLSRDPIEEDGGRALYCFVLNAPLIRSDAFGLCDDSAGSPLSCPCLVKVRLGNDSIDALKDMLKAHINWVNEGGRPSDSAAEGRVLDNLILLGRKGGRFGFAMLARTACGPTLNIRAITLDNKDVEAGWKWRKNQLLVDAFYKWYGYMNPPMMEIMKDDSISDWGVAGAIILGHELGHGYIGLDDPFNYRIVENSIRAAFGVPNRDKYDDVYPDVPYEWTGIGTMIGVPDRVPLVQWRADMQRATSTALAFANAWSCH